MSVKINLLHKLHKNIIYAKPLSTQLCSCSVFFGATFKKLCEIFKGVNRLSSSVVFQLLAPAVDWLDYLSSSLSPLDLNDTEPVVLYAREYLQQVSDLINKTDRRSGTLPPRLRGRPAPPPCRDALSSCLSLQSTKQLHDLDSGSEDCGQFGSTLRECPGQTFRESHWDQKGTKMWCEMELI